MCVESSETRELVELLAAARRGDAAASQRLGRLVLEVTRPIAKRAALRYRLCPDELHAEAALVLWESVLVGFDPRRGSLRGYARARVRWLSVDLVRRSTAARRGGGSERERYDEVSVRERAGALRSLPANETTPEAEVAAAESMRAAIGADALVRRVVRRRIEGLTSREIASEVGRHPAQVTRWLQTLRRKLA